MNFSYSFFLIGFLISLISMFLSHTPFARHRHHPQKHTHTPFTVVHFTSLVTVEEKCCPLISTAVTIVLFGLAGGNPAPLILMIGFAFGCFTYEPSILQRQQEKKKALKGLFSAVTHLLGNLVFDPPHHEWYNLSELYSFWITLICLKHVWASLGSQSHLDFVFSDSDCRPLYPMFL